MHQTLLETMSRGSPLTNHGTGVSDRSDRFFQTAHVLTRMDVAVTWSLDSAHLYLFTCFLTRTHTHIHTHTHIYIYARTCIHMHLISNRCVDHPFHRFLIAPHIPHGWQAGKQVMYRSPPLRQERKIVEDTTDDEAHAKDHKVCPG